MFGNGDGTFATPASIRWRSGRSRLSPATSTATASPISPPATVPRSSSTTAVPSLRKPGTASPSCAVRQRRHIHRPVELLDRRSESHRTHSTSDDDRYRNTLTLVEHLRSQRRSGDRSDRVAWRRAAQRRGGHEPAADVNAGPDTLLQNTRETVLRPIASDPGRRHVDVGDPRRDRASHLDVPERPAIQGLHPGVNTFTVTVDDGHGHRATDTVVYTCGVDRPAARLSSMRPTLQRSRASGAVHHPLARRRPAAIRWRDSTCSRPANNARRPLPRSPNAPASADGAGVRLAASRPRRATRAASR